MDGKDINYTPTGIDEIISKQFVRFIDTTPTATNPTWSVVGVGVEDGNANIEYNAQVDRTKWIIDKNAHTKHSSNDKQMSVTQKCHKGDPEFEFVERARDVLGYKSHVLEIDTWNGTNSSYPSKYSDCTITINTYSGDTIEYTVYFDGDPTIGTSTISNGTPTFTPTTSL